RRGLPEAGRRARRLPPLPHRTVSRGDHHAGPGADEAAGCGRGGRSRLQLPRLDDHGDAVDRPGVRAQRRAPPRAGGHARAHARVLHHHRNPARRHRLRAHTGRHCGARGGPPGGIGERLEVPRPCSDPQTRRSGDGRTAGVRRGGVAGFRFVAVGIPYVMDAFTPQIGNRAMGYYVASLVAGGLLGRVGVALLTAAFGWRIGVGSMAALPLAATLTMARSLPDVPLAESTCISVRAVTEHLRNRPLLLTTLAGSGMFFAFVGVFSYVEFRLEAPPFSY